MMKYDEQQAEAINSIYGPVMIVSCAGSGKTSVILERTNKIIQSGVNSKKILVVTFSKSAAAEMKERFAAKYENSNVNFLTIHSVCFSILKAHLGLNPSSILKDYEKKAFLREKYYELKRKYGSKIDEQFKDIDEFYVYMSLKLSEYMILLYKNNFYEDVIKEDYVKYTYNSYLKHKKATGKIDFDDMIIKCHKCLKSQKDVLLFWQNHSDYIMIDEYQDTNILQAEIFFMLSGDKKNICIVGDDDQSIYSFRDADSMIFNRFIKEYPNAKQIFLETNYRSKPKIIFLASNLIDCNINRFSKKFLTYKTGESKVEVISVDGCMGQVNKVIKFIEDYRKRNIPFNSIAILYRTKREAKTLCTRLQVLKIPFFVKDLPENLYNGMVYNDLKSYYRLANDLWGSTDLHRIINRPNRYIKSDVIVNCNLNRDEILRRCFKDISSGEKKEQINKVVEQLFIDLKELRGLSPSDFMKYLLINMKYRESLIAYANFVKADPNTFTDDFDELLNEAGKFDLMSEWDDFATECKNKKEKEMVKNKDEGIYLSTFHSSKGLEWDNVIIISANDGVTPLVRGEKIENPEEERRLFYVAMTRAKEELSILYYTTEDNQGKGSLPSRYIAEMQMNNSNKPKSKLQEIMLKRSHENSIAETVKNFV